MPREPMFSEIEHKFVLDEYFDFPAFAESVSALKPIRESVISVEDTYFVTNAYPSYIYRHRIDEEIQQLSMKSMGADSEERLEINLNLLPQSEGNQRESIRAFLQPQGIRGVFTLHKKVWAYYFKDIEIVYYVASIKERTLKCVEFEAKGSAEKEECIKTIRLYEKKLNFNAEQREHKSLFQLLLAPELEGRGVC